MAYWNRGGWPKSETVASRKARAQRKLAEITKRGHTPEPVVAEGRTFVHTFWGKAWCQNLESYSDLANRLGRGRSYLRHGSVIDLRIDKGRIQAQVQGSDLYQVTIRIEPVPASHWKRVRETCAGRIDSVIELLSGKLSKGVMEIICEREEGLFPAPREIDFRCTCPDAASMCKHIAASLYGVGVRLDQSPELLFTLRNVDALELVRGVDALATPKAPAGSVPAGDLAELFGIELAPAEVPAGPTPTRSSPRPRSTPAKRPGARRTQAAKKP
jgi:uncharacterized Zn finger protein